MLLMPPSAFQSTQSFHSLSEQDYQKKTMHEQLEQLQLEIGRLRSNNEAQKTSGRGTTNATKTHRAAVCLQISLNVRHP